MNITMPCQSQMLALKPLELLYILNRNTEIYPNRPCTALGAPQRRETAHRFRPEGNQNVKWLKNLAIS